MTASEELHDIGMAKEIAETLHEHYPGHAWAVFIRDGLVWIKNFANPDPNILDKCMVMYYNNLGDAGVRKRKVIMAGGEYLERFSMKRGAYELA